MLSGKAVYICDDCVVLALSTIASPYQGKPAPASYFVEALCVHLDTLDDESQWGRCADAALLLAADDEEALRRILRVSIRGPHEAHTVEAARRLADARLSAWEQIGVAVAHYHLAEHRRALEILDAVDTDVPSHLARIALDRIGNRLRLPEPMSDTELRQAIETLGALAAELGDKLGRAVFGHRAECQLRLGDARGAQESLALITDPLGPLQHMIAGDACRALGDREGARAAYEAGAQNAKRAIAAAIEERLRELG